MSKKRKKGFGDRKARVVARQAPELPEADTLLDPAASHIEVNPSDKKYSALWDKWFRPISPVAALAVIAVVGFVTFSWGLPNQFAADDQPQLQDNTLVHSLDHLGDLFEGSTIYQEKHTQQPGLAGIYYRPLMLVTYAVIYTVFGSSAFWFHLIQLILFIGCCFVLFLVLRYFFRPGLSLALALIFLVDPVNTQNVYYIANLQEPLYFFFGILGLWTYLRYQDRHHKYLALTAASLFLSLLGKESGILFVAITLAYAWITDKRRCRTLALYLIVPLALYASLRIHALGFKVNIHTSPIDSLTFLQRLITMPSIVWFYLEKAVWPWKIVTYYYWTEKTMTLGGFWLPLVGDLVIFGALWRVGEIIRRHNGRRLFMLYVFFALWFVIGLALNLQIIPLDVTVAEPWFIVSLAGLLGIMGVLLESMRFRLRRKWVLIMFGCVVAGFAYRSAIRAPDWYNSVTMAQVDIKLSNDDYISDAVVANQMITDGNYAQAYALTRQSLAVHPNAGNYAVLAHLLFLGGDYSQAQTAYMDSINELPIQTVLDQMAELQLYDYSPGDSMKNIERSIYLYPKDGVLWTAYGLLNYKIGNIYVGQDAIMKAYGMHDTNAYAYNAIMKEQPVHIDIMGHPQLITPTAQALANPNGTGGQSLTQ